jgi:hypothetical protein
MQLLRLTIIARTLLFILLAYQLYQAINPKAKKTDEDNVVKTSA